MTVLGALARRPQAAIQATPWGDWGDSTSATTHAGATVTTSSSLQLLTVYGCNRFICDGISTLPVDTFRVGPGKVAVETEPPPWVENPTADLNRVAWGGQTLTSMLLGGDSFSFKVFRRNALAELIPVDPGTVEVFRKSGRKWYRINGVEVDPFNILHIPAVMFPGKDRGLSPVEAARQSIGMGLASKEFGGRFFGQGTTLSGVIEVPGELAPEKAREMARAWAKKHGGASKSNLPGVLQGGAQWKPTQLSNEQSQFLETQGYTASEIAGQMFLIDPAEMGLPVQGTSLTYANLTERNERRVQVTFLPWIVRLELALSALLPDGEYLKINTDGLLRGSTKTRWDTYKIGVDLGALEVSEVRALEDLPPLPEKPPAPPDLAGQIEAVGQLIRAGFDPAAALDLFGLPPIKHTGYVPVTVTSPTPTPQNVAGSRPRADDRNRQPSHVNVDIQMPEVDPPVVNVTVPQGAPPVVNVTTDAPQVTIENIVPVPEVNVTNDVQPAGVTVIDNPKTRNVVRDAKGNITKVVEE